MIRRIAFGAAALALTVSGLAVTAGPAAAGPKPEAVSIHCPALSGDSVASNAVPNYPGLPLDGRPVKRVTLTATLNAPGCSVVGGINGAEFINNIVVTTVTKYKNITIADLAPTPPPLDVTVFSKLTVSFRNGTTPICVNKAKAGQQETDVVTGTAVLSTILGGKGLGGKCFKGKAVHMLHTGGPILHESGNYFSGISVTLNNGMEGPLFRTSTLDIF